MKLKIRFLAILSILALGVLACDLSTALPSAVSSSGSHNVLFQDDFSDPTSGWSVSNETDRVIAYQDGGLRFFVNQAHYDYWSVPGLNFSDVHIDADATKLAGPDDNDLGILCRYRDQNNFYGFLISSDGYYGISKMKNGEHTLIGMDGMRVSQTIQTGQATNHIRADCIGSTLALYVNGEKLYEVQDADFTSGDVGLLVGTFDQPGADVRFNNFVVTEP